MTKLSWHQWLTLSLLVCCFFIVTEAYLPALPLVGAALNAEEMATKHSLSYALLTFSLGLCVFGPLSDWVGRKELVQIGLSLALLATLFAYHVTAIETLIAAKCVQSLGLSMVTIAMRALYADLFVGKALSQQLSRLNIFLPVCLMLAASLGGMVTQQFGWRALFLGLSLLLGGLLIATSRFPYPQLRKRCLSSAFELWQQQRQLLTNPNFIVFSLMTTLPQLGLYAFATLAPHHLQQTWDFNTAQLGYSLAMMTALVMLVAAINFFLVQKLPLHTLMKLGCGSMILAGIGVGASHYWSESVLGLIVPAGLFYATKILWMLNGFALCLSRFSTHCNGTATGLMSCIQFLLGSLGSLLFSHIQTDVRLWLGVCFGGIGLVCLLGLVWLKQTNQQCVAEVYTL